MSYCCVPFCTSNRTNGKGTLSFHEFPLDQDTFKEWVNAISCDNSIPNSHSAYSVVCSLHFKEDDYSFVGKSRRLKKGSVPSVFPNYPKVTSTKSPQTRVTEAVAALGLPKKRKRVEAAYDSQNPDVSCSTSNNEGNQTSVAMDNIDEIKLEPTWDEESESLCLEQPSSEDTQFAFVKCEVMCKDEPEETEEDNSLVLKEDGDSKGNECAHIDKCPENWSTTAPAVSDGIKKSQPCPHCNKRFKKPSYLAMHIELVHAESKRLQCTKCEASFTTVSNLNRHQKSHIVQKTFSCSICSKLFTRNDTLKEHMFRHDGVRPFLCSMCSRTFTRKSALVQHQAVHTGSRSYECAVCRKCYRWKSDLQKHSLKHT